MKKILGLIFLISWVAGEAPRLFWKEILPMRPMDAAAAIIFLTEIIKNKRNKYYKNYKNTCLIIAVLAGSWVLGLRMWSLAEAFGGLLYLARTLVYFWLIWRAKKILGEVRQWIPRALAVFVGLGLLQYIFLPNTRFLLEYGWDEHYWRLIGTVLDPNYFGVMAGMIVFWAIKNYKDYKSHNQWIAVAAFMALILTWSRASWLAFGLAAGWWGLSGKSGRLGRLGILGGLSILGVMVWWAAPKSGGEGVNLLRTASIQQRLASWNKAISVWRQHPWVGVGFNNYGVGSREYGVGKEGHAGNAPSSSWLLLLATTGIVGTVGIIIGGTRVIGELRESKFWVGVLMMIGIHAVFNNTLFYPPILGLVAMMRGVDDI